MIIMQWQAEKLIFVSAVLFMLFLLITIMVRFIDVQPIGPQKTSVGLASLNKIVKDRIGANHLRYKITEQLGWVAIAVAASFGILGLCQLIKTKNLFMVDRDIILLGIFYTVVMCLYAFFEKCIINYRPILVKGRIEASFPSSHTMVVVFVMVSAMCQFSVRITNPVLCRIAIGWCGFITIVTVAGRMLSGAHWFTDIIAGLLLSFSLVFAYTGLRAII